MKFLIQLILSCIAVSCVSRYSNFKSIGDKVHFKLIEIGDEGIPVKDSSYLQIQYEYCTDEICETSEKQYVTNIYTNVNFEFWKDLNLGDKLLVVLDSAPGEYWINLFDLSDKKIHWPVIVKLKLADLISESTADILSHDSNLLTFREQKRIEGMIKKDTLKYLRKNECFVAVLDSGQGNKIEKNVEINLSYKAFYSNGIMFDDTDDWKDSLVFMYGQDFQIIPGLEFGIEGLREGAETKIIIPSHLAFGKMGSTSGIVPPYEPLMYNVKIISVKQTHL